jgi:hypothetical protein
LKRGAVAILVLAISATAAAHPLMTKSQARAIVRDVNLKAGDMRGYDSMPTTKPTAEDRRRDVELARCGGSTPMSKSLAWGQSRAFIRGNLDDYVIFASTVLVYRTGADLTTDLRALRTSRWRECFRTSIIESERSSGYAAEVTLTALRTNVSGVFGYRIKFEPITTASVPTTYSDLFFMGTRTTEARVVVSASPDAPTQKQDDKVVRIVRTRLQARANPNAVL